MNRAARLTPRPKAGEIFKQLPADKPRGDAVGDPRYGMLCFLQVRIKFNARSTCIYTPRARPQ